LCQSSFDLVTNLPPVTVTVRIVPDGSVRVCAAANWVQPEKRERKQRVNYNQNQYFKDAMNTHAGR